MNRDWVRIEPDALVLDDYPLPRGQRAPRVPAKELVEVEVGWFPPAVLTKEGEFLFVAAPQAQALHDFAQRHRIPFVRRLDVWSLLLEPFLDTGQAPEASERTLKVLEENEVPRKEAAQVREALKFRMLMLAAVTWEWVHFGMFDALSQMKGFPFLEGWSFDRFYEYAMSLGGRGQTSPATGEQFLAGFVRDRARSPGTSR